MSIASELICHEIGRLALQFISDSQLDFAAMAESEAIRALQKIKAIIDDDSLDDLQCFMRIEKIVRIYDCAGSDGGCRHDFG